MPKARILGSGTGTYFVGRVMSRGGRTHKALLETCWDDETRCGPDIRAKIERSGKN